MPDREFIHAASDVASVLVYALDSGMEVMIDEPLPEPAARMLVKDEAVKLTRGQFFVFRPEWVYGPFQTMAISAGHRRGMYFVQPRVNYSAISVSFQGERVDQARRRFGHASVSSYRDSLELPAKIIRPAPPDTDVWFKRLASHLSSGIVVKAGVHKYRVCKGVITDPAAAECLPPFDFIPWGREVLQAARK